MRSGQGIPNWSSPLECLKLAVGTLVFECCASDGVIEVGYPPRGTILGCGIIFASSDVVIALLQAGVDAYGTDIMGNDGLMLAASFGRLDNIKAWFSKNSEWKVNKRSSRYGTTALHLAAYIGPEKFDTVQYLIEKKKADIHLLNKSGASALLLACSNEVCCLEQ